MDFEEEKNSSLGNALSLLSDSALVLVMSQSLLLLKQSHISNRQKQLLKRELCDELVRNNVTLFDQSAPLNFFCERQTKEARIEKTSKQFNHRSMIVVLG